VDNDPLVLAHARALLTNSPQGTTDYVNADMREPSNIVEAAVKLLDFGKPVALMFMGVLGHVSDYDQARSIVRTLRDALPSGSYLALDEGADTSPVLNEAQEGYNKSGAVPYALRSRAAQRRQPVRPRSRHRTSRGAADVPGGRRWSASCASSTCSTCVRETRGTWLLIVCGSTGLLVRGVLF
jgi:hypothetical protein